MPTSVPRKLYNSVFASEIQIDEANYLTEILIKNYLHFIKCPLPNFPFWRKEYANQSQKITELSKRYQVELIGIKQLLRKFNAQSIAKDFVENKRFLYKMGKKATQLNIEESISSIEEQLNRQDLVEVITTINTDTKIAKAFSRGPKRIAI